MPDARPPCTWPSTSIGLRMRPQSSTAMWRIGSTRPVSVSTSTTDTCAPNGNDAPDCTKSCSTASGRPSSLAFVAISAQVIAFDGTPATPSVPSSVSTMSSGAASSISAARLRARSSTPRDALEHGAAADLQRPRSARPTAARHEGGVGLHERDAIHRDAELTGDELRVSGGMALPVGRRARLHGGAPVGVHLHLGVLARGAAGGDLDVGADADTEQLDVAASRRAACSARRSSYPAMRSASVSAVS